MRLALIAALLCVASVAHAQSAEELSAPAPSRAEPVEQQRPDVAEPAIDPTALAAPTPNLGPLDAAAAANRGPRVELGIARFTLGDGEGGGGQTSGFFGGYLPFGALRLGGAIEIGVRDYSIAGTEDLVLRAQVTAGYQALEGFGPFVPYVAAMGTAGLILGKRFHTTVSYEVVGVGVEAGVDLVLVRSLFIGAGLTLAELFVEGDGALVGMLRLRVGL